MTATFRTPDGTEVTAAQDTSRSPMCVWVVHPTLGLIAVDQALLTKVPPAPAEPADGSHVECNSYVFTRRDKLGKLRDPYGENPGAHWFQGGGDGMTWAEVVAYGKEFGKPLQLLVPDPAQDAPELPWARWHCPCGGVGPVQQASSWRCPGCGTDHTRDLEMGDSTP